MKYCGSCGAEAEDNARYCPRCGCGMGQHAAQERTPDKARDASGGLSSAADTSATHAAGADRNACQAYPEKYTVWCILEILFCCWIPAVVALVYSSKIDRLLLEGKVDEAEKASETTKTWLVAGAILGGCLQLFSLIAFVAAAAMGALK